MPFEIEELPTLEFEGAPDVLQSTRWLVEFIGWVENFLDQMARQASEIRDENEQPYFEPFLVKRFQTAHNEAVEQGQFRVVINYLLVEPGARLFRHGLTGEQLIAKMTNIKFWREKLVDEEVQFRRSGKMTRSILSRLFSSIDSLLGSIMDVVPGGGAIEELKEALENARTVMDE